MTRTQTANVLPPAAPSPAELERLLARGRHLHAEAVQEGFRGLFRFMVGGCRLRVLRLPGSLPGQRQPCC